MLYTFLVLNHLRPEKFSGTLAYFILIQFQFYVYLTLFNFSSVQAPYVYVFHSA